MTRIFYESLKDTDKNVYAQEQEPHDNRLHFHRAFEIIYIKSGSCEMEVANKSFVAETDDIIFVHRYYTHRSTMLLHHSKYVVAVPEHYSTDFKEYFENETLACHLNDKEFNKTLLPYFEELITKQGTLPKTVTKGFLNVIFGYLKSHYAPEEIHNSSKNVSVIIEILNYIDSQCHENLTLSALATKFGYNKTYFSRLFNRYIGVSVRDYINSARLNKIDELKNRNPDACITELAIAAGFQSLATYYRAKNS